MARRTFFSFYHQRDVSRAWIVRNSWVTHDSQQAAGFWDAGLREKVKRQGDAAIRRAIDAGLKGTSVTVVLIGAETAPREWVRYEIEQSVKRDNALIGIYIHNIPDMDGRLDRKGPDPFASFVVQTSLRREPLSGLVPTYDWQRGNGHRNLGTWIERAYRQGPANKGGTLLAIPQQGLPRRHPSPTAASGPTKLGAGASLVGVPPFSRPVPRRPHLLGTPDDPYPPRWMARRRRRRNRLIR